MNFFIFSLLLFIFFVFLLFFAVRAVFIYYCRMTFKFVRCGIDLCA